MSYLPWIAAGAFAGYAYRQHGRRAKGEYETREGKIPTRDDVTGEPLPPYGGRGRPRTYNSLATKRVAVMKGEFYSTITNLPRMGHIWRAENLEDFLGDIGQMRNDFNLAAVCDGGLRFRGEPVIFDQKNGKQFKTGPGRGREIYECYARPGRDETGEIMTMARYYNVKGKRRKKKKVG